jgi:6,7-dimethyl-8-ribityllumazine synthase
MGGRFAIVASTYNARYVDALLRSARSELRRSGAKEIRVVRVPGAFEIPAVAARLAGGGSGPWSAILCLGVVFQGETRHAGQIGDAVSTALALLQVQFQSPFLHGVYLFENEEQARVRCLGRRHNRGIELARTAIEMARVMTRL